MGVFRRWKITEHVNYTIALKTENCHDASFVVAGDTTGCHADNKDNL